MSASDELRAIMEITTELMERKYTGTMPARLIIDARLTGLSTNRDKIVELWSLLEYYYAIDETRDNFLRAKGIKDKRQLKSVGTSFSSYITQARNFYTYAQNSDYRSAALLYYYSFLNLAKAKLVIEKPELVDKKFIHGIERKKDTGDILKQTCGTKTIHSRNVVGTFNELYELRFNKQLKATNAVSINDLLGYCTGVQVEYQKVTGTVPKVAPVLYHIAIDAERKKSWVKLAVFDWGRLSKFKTTFKPFTDEFSKISISNISRQLSWEISPYSIMWYTFFESNTEFDFLGTETLDTFSCDDQLKKLFMSNYQPELYNRNGGFQLLAPLRQNLQMPGDELIAIYAIMFHLSEVVRYKPELFETVLSNETKSGWLIKNFIESCPSTFLQYMAGWITGEQYIIERR